MRTIAPPQKILDGVTTTGDGNTIYVMDYDYLLVTVHTTGSANGTLKFKGSQAEDAPSFDSAQGPTNKWDFIAVDDYEDKTSIDGDTGLVLSGTDDNRQFKVNMDGLRYFTADLESRSAGTWYVDVTGYSAGK